MYLIEHHVTDYFFVVLSCHYLVQDGSINIFKLSTLEEVLLINPGNIKNKFIRKILGNAENRTRGCWVRSANTTSTSVPIEVEQRNIVLSNIFLAETLLIKLLRIKASYKPSLPKIFLQKNRSLQFFFKSSRVQISFLAQIFFS